MASINHYSTLGILSTADPVVIRAAYKALAQVYHPDKWNGDPDEANARMAELNAAYKTLSDPTLRKAYDESIKERSDGERSFSANEGGVESDPSFDPLASEWAVAVSFFPDLIHIEQQLRDFSWRIALAFRASLLETQAFETRHELSNKIQNDFVRRHFGKNLDIQEFAVTLIKEKNRQAARELNKAISVLGDNVGADMIIEKIALEYCPPDYETPRKRRLTAAADALKKKEEQYRKWKSGATFDPEKIKSNAPFKLIIVFVFTKIFLASLLIALFVKL